MMPLCLCITISTFQWCVFSNFSDMIENSIEVFMDNFYVFVSDFDQLLDHLIIFLKSYVETSQVLNWQKYHFMVTECIILGHKILSKGI